MKETKYLKDLQQIREIMNRSSRFLSLSGWSGICAGSFAIIGAYLAYQQVYAGQDYLSYRSAHLGPEVIFRLLAIALGVLLLSVFFGFYFSKQKAKREGQSMWNATSKRMLINFAIPLVTGGLLCLQLLSKGYVGVIAPLTLIFYGLALVNASKFTLDEVRSLGIFEIVLGLLAMQFIGYGLIFWSIGFGALHIVYGAMMQMKYAS